MNSHFNNKSYELFVFVLLLIMIAGSVFIIYFNGFTELVHRWSTQDEYSFGYFIPLVSLYFIYQKRNEIIKEERKPAWAGVFVIMIALFTLLIGELSAIYLLVHYSFVVLVLGLVWSYAGIRVLKLILVPILILLFAIPLPYFIDSALSWRLQLLSSSLGVDIIRIFDIPVYLEGNVIDLGGYQLQVVEACSGLSYLFPLMSIGFISAYLYSAPVWQKIVLFVSTIPITILMNSFRIGVIGILVNYWGVDMAEGFLHYFEGWVVFMVCLLMLMVEIWILTKLRSDKPRFFDVFMNYEVDKTSQNVILQPKLSTTLLVSALIITIMAISLTTIIKREEIYPDRLSFNLLPLELEQWKGQQENLTPRIVQKLNLEDYFVANYNKQDTLPVNLYLAYYKSQRKGSSPHSPRVCIPGGGWKINQIRTESIKLNSQVEIPVNKIIIEKNGHKQLVYYWFQQRGRKIANEYLMKWYLLQDSIFKNRTDGALIRFTTNLSKNSSVDDADKRIKDLIDHIHPLLDDYIPK